MERGGISKKGERATEDKEEETMRKIHDIISFENVIMN